MCDVKTWSDLKNNTKKKSAKIHRAAQGTGGGPALNITLSDIEQRVLSIIGIRAATGIAEIPEIGLELEVWWWLHILYFYLHPCPQSSYLS